MWIYRAVPEREPQQPQASYALGVVSAAAGHNEEALSLLENAIEVKPTAQQFWFSFIDALKLVDRIDAARKALLVGENSGVITGALRVWRLD